MEELNTSVQSVSAWWCCCNAALYFNILFILSIFRMSLMSSQMWRWSSSWPTTTPGRRTTVPSTKVCECEVSLAALQDSVVHLHLCGQMSGISMCFPSRRIWGEAALHMAWTTKVMWFVSLLATHCFLVWCYTMISRFAASLEAVQQCSALVAHRGSAFSQLIFYYMCFKHGPENSQKFGHCPILFDFGELKRRR